MQKLPVKVSRHHFYCKGNSCMSVCVCMWHGIQSKWTLRFFTSPAFRVRVSLSGQFKRWVLLAPSYQNLSLSGGLGGVCPCGGPSLQGAWWSLVAIHWPWLSVDFNSSSNSSSMVAAWLPNNMPAVMQKTARVQVTEIPAHALPADIRVVFANCTLPVPPAKESWHGALAWLLLQMCAEKEQWMLWKAFCAKIHCFRSHLGDLGVLCHSLCAVLILLLILPSACGLLPQEVGGLFPLCLLVAPSWSKRPTLHSIMILPKPFLFFCPY